MKDINDANNVSSKDAKNVPDPDFGGPAGVGTVRGLYTGHVALFPIHLTRLSASLILNEYAPCA